MGCIKHNTKLIHLSSTSVYGVSGNLVDEKSKIKPQSPYAEVKLIEENLLKLNKKKLSYISLRFGTIAGVSPNIRFHTAINKFSYQAALSKPITVWRKLYTKKKYYLQILVKPKLNA